MPNLDLIRGRQVVVPLANQSGSAASNGDVVVVDVANDDSFTVSTSSNYTGQLGVLQEDTAAGSNGRVLVSGYAPRVNTLAHTALGSYLYQSTTARRAAHAAFAATGAFGYVINDGAGYNTRALIFPPLQGVGGGASSISAGSNSMDVSGISAAGASTSLWSPYDHRHKGVALITSSSSNNLETPTVNLRPGSGIAFGASDSNGNGVFDTLTISSTASGGGGGGAADQHSLAMARWHIYPFTSTSSASFSITAATSGQRIILVVGTRGNDVTSVTCTNTTWSEILGANSSTTTYLSVYLGIVSGGSSGTTITINVGGTNFVFASAVIVEDTLTGSVTGSTSVNGAVAGLRKSLIGPVTSNNGDAVVMAYTTNDASGAVSEMHCSTPLFWVPDDSLCGIHLLVGKASSTEITGWFDGGNGTVVAGIVAFS